MCVVFFFQAEDGIRDLVRSRGLGDVYKRQSVYFLINLFFLCATPLLAQTCFPDGIRFTSQNEIDNFAIEYPGCFAIEGSLIIGDPDYPCLLYTSDAADERSSVDLGGRRIIKKK